jgi:hypothetical protein
MDIDKVMKDRQNGRERMAEHYWKRYKPYMQSLEKSPLARVRSLNEMDYFNLGKQLEQFETYVKINEENGSVTALGTLPKIALDALTINFGASPINVIASVQPIDEVQGLVYFRDFQAQNTRGNVTAGQNILSSLQAPDVFPQGYAGEGVTASNFINVPGGGTQAFTNVPAGGTGDFMSPINPQTMTISGSAIVTVSSVQYTVVYSNIQPDSTGNFSQMVQAGTTGTFIGVYGSVNFDNGTITLELTQAPTGATSFFASFETVPEKNTDLQSAILVLQSKPVNAQFYALKSTIGLAEAYMLNKRFGLSAEEEIAKDLTVAINNEIMNTAVNLILANIPNGTNSTYNNQVTWGREPQSGVDYFSHKMTLLDAMADTDAKIVASAGRGAVNVWMAGRQAAAIISTLPGFKKLFDDNSFGPHIYGTIGGVTIVRVPYQSVLDDNTMVGLFKGKSAFESPLVWAPYMPLVVTNLLPMAYNPLESQRAVAVWGALDSLIPTLSAKLTISESSFNYGSV